MSKLTEKVKILNKAYTKFQSIENEKDLKKNGLTLSDYRILFDVLQELNKCDIIGMNTMTRILSTCHR